MIQCCDASSRGSHLANPRKVRGFSWREYFLTEGTPNGGLDLVLKRGLLSNFQGGLTGRLLLLLEIPPRIVLHA
jgi:hypothetical protein